ncbi:hypothetical protein OV320_7868 [Actinobacteria bacterium OV320]|jgi:hypothetical protein|nr:hypothetical protein OV320_7868 [Actinobacteria bacterium OV320]
MNWIEVFLGGGAGAVITGLGALYKSVKDESTKERSEVLEWNDRLEHKVNALMESNDLLVREVHGLRTRVFDLELFIRKHDLEPPE